MALTLLAEATDPATAQAVQLAIEYDPRPPCPGATSPPSGPGERHSVPNWRSDPASCSSSVSFSRSVRSTSLPIRYVTTKV